MHVMDHQLSPPLNVAYVSSAIYRKSFRRIGSSTKKINCNPFYNTPVHVSISERLKPESTETMRVFYLEKELKMGIRVRIQVESKIDRNFKRNKLPTHLMIIFDEVMHLLNFLRTDCFEDIVSVVRHQQLGSRFSTR